MAIHNGYNSPFNNQLKSPLNSAGFLPVSEFGNGGSNSFNWANAANPMKNTMGIETPGYGIGWTDIAGQQLQDIQSMGYNGGGGPGAKRGSQLFKQQMGLGNQKLGQDTPWTWGGPGGKAATGLAGLQTVGGLYMANEARKLGAEDLNFRRQSFNDQYASQRSLVNDQLFDRQRRRNLESGMGTEAAGTAADEYVKNRGVA